VKRSLHRRYGRAKSAAVPFFGGRCYACGAKGSGFRDRRPEGGNLETACARHRDPKIKTFEACMYCSGPVRKGSVEIDDDFAHKSCHKEASGDFGPSPMRRPM
jgi:hypothetical protein